MPDRISQQEINDTLWRACDTFRGTLDPAQYKDYLLVMLFLKYVSDVWTDKQEELQERHKGDKVRVERALGRERFVVPPESHFKYLYERRDAPNIGELINIGLEQIEDTKRAKEVGSPDYYVYGQEVNGGTWALCKMNMFLHGVDNAQIEWGDTLNSPKLIEGDHLKKFNVVVANPPFSLDKWGAEHAAADPFR